MGRRSTVTRTKLADGLRDHSYHNESQDAGGWPNSESAGRVEEGPVEDRARWKMGWQQDGWNAGAVGDIRPQGEQSASSGAGAWKPEGSCAGAGDQPHHAQSQPTPPQVSMESAPKISAGLVGEWESSQLQDPKADGELRGCRQPDTASAVASAAAGEQRVSS